MSNDQAKGRRVPGFYLTRVGRVMLACILLAVAIWPVGIQPQATQAAPVCAPQTPTPPAPLTPTPIPPPLAGEGAAEVQPLNALPAESEEPTLSPETTGTILSPCDIVHLKLQESARVRLRGRGLVSLAGDDVHALVSLLDGWPGSRIARIFTRSETQLDAERAEIQQQSHQALPDLNSWYVITLPYPDDQCGIVHQLLAMPIVEQAYPDYGVELATVEEHNALSVGLRYNALLPPDLTHLQGYLTSAPAGIDARYAWTVPGGKGLGVSLVDVEGDWNLEHEDLRDSIPGREPFFGTRTGVLEHRNHGTAVLGEIVGTENGYGITGIAPQAGVSVAAVDPSSVATAADAINAASAVLLSGDVILAELEIPGFSWPCNSLPIEWNGAAYDAITTAVAKGIIVVEAAGNGGHNLDNSIIQYCSGHLSRPCSGAIMVGAGSKYDRSRLSLSNYGSCVDLQGWGHHVFTAGYGDSGYSGINENEWYTSDFDATSSAAAIVAGAVLDLQGVAILNGGALSPTEIRDILVATGSPQTGSEHIGPLPNLRAAIEATVAQRCPRKGQGDADCDGDVDGVDYSIWLNSQCRSSPSQRCEYYRADFNRDGSIDDDDYEIWYENRYTQGLSPYPGLTDRLPEVSAAPLAASNVTLALDPSPYTFGLNEIKTYELKAIFTNGSPSETVDHFKTEISFSTQYLEMPADNYVYTSQSGFRVIFQVYGPKAASENGKIIIELDAGWPGSGPSTAGEITIARIDFEAIALTSSAQTLTIGNTQVVNNQGEEIPASSQVASYTVVPSVVVTSTWTTDGDGSPKSAFDRGDSIRYNERFYNSTGSWQTVYYSLSVDGPCGSIGSWSGNLDLAPGTSWLYVASNIPNDACGGTYTYQISVTYNSRTSSRSTTFTVVPNAPTGLSAWAVSSLQIDLSWNDPGGEKDGYKVYRDGSYVGSTSSTNYQDTGLDCETPYSYNVKAYKGSYESDPSNTANATTQSCQPDLRPYAPSGYPYPVVPSSVQGTHEVNTLYAGQPTYFDWHFINSGDATASGSFHVELWVGGTKYVRYPYSDCDAGWSGGFDDWMETISTPGWHTVRLITDPDNTVDESDENNNVWEGQFYWESSGPLVYSAHTVDDDTSGESNGNGDGIVDCGETIELYVDLYNQGDNTATGVNATISTSDSYVTWLDNTDSSYSDISGGGTGTNSNDFDFAVDSSAPDGHVIHFDLNITASNGGPWSDSFDVTVGEAPEENIYLPIILRNAR